MSKEQTEDLLHFLKPFGSDVTDLVIWLREFVWNQYPLANELIYDNYNSLALGWSPTSNIRHVFCSIIVGRSRKGIAFGLYSDSTLSDPDKIFLGEDSRYRHTPVTDQSIFPTTYIKLPLKEAYTNSILKIVLNGIDPNKSMHGQTIVKSVSQKKRQSETARKDNITASRTSASSP